MSENRIAAPALRFGAAMAHETPGRAHPLLREARSLHDRGALSRRDFLRYAGLLGAAVAPWPGAAARAAETPIDGGALHVAMPVRAIKDPALFDWIEKSNLVRGQNEHLTITGGDNITRPMLAEGWSASDDLKTWTFTLRPSAMWHNGEPLTAAHVAANFERWLDPATGSSNRALLAPLAGAGGGVEIVDERTIRLHLSTAMLSLPESLYNYPTAILHPSFEGDIVAQPMGTGPYRLDGVTPGENASLSRVRADGYRYWGEGHAHIGPGRLDAIVFRHTEPGAVEGVDLLRDGSVDLVYELGLDALDAARTLAPAQVLARETAQTGCMRMRVDKAPFDDHRVRRALQLSAVPSAFPRELFDGRGRSAEHHHVAPLHPDYFRLPPLWPNHRDARVLLAEAGYPDGITVTLDVGNTSGPWQQRAAELFRDQAAEAGITVNVNVVSAETYQESWISTPFGLTQWAHRPLGTMALSLAYRSGAPWNETGFADPEFDAALDAAEAVLEVTARRTAMRRVESILQESAVMVQPIWTPVFALASRRLRGFDLQPTQYLPLNNAWLAG